MSKREDAKIAKLIKKNAAPKPAPKPGIEVQYDPTLRLRPADDGSETKRLFKEMKKREF